MYAHSCYDSFFVSVKAYNARDLLFSIFVNKVLCAIIKTAAI